MKKMFLIIVVFFVLIPYLSAESITGLTVPTSVNLGEKMAVSGQYNNTDVNTNVLCKFQAENSEGVFIERWSDERTFTDGTFYAERTLVEPPYFRGEDFNIVVTCGLSTGEAMFRVDLRRDFVGVRPAGLLADWSWWTNSDNSYTIVFTVFAVIVILFFSAVVFYEPLKSVL